MIITKIIAKMPAFGYGCTDKSSGGDRAMQMLPIRRAILSVTDKSGLTDFATFLVKNNVELVSTGGTQKALESAGLPVIAVSAVTGFPEILNGRVKTLHPKIHAGILANKDDPSHLQTLVEKDIRPFDLICVNLYDFAGAVERRLSLEEAVEEIDIGGPCMLRAGAKNFYSALVLPSPQWYEAAMRELQKNDMAVGLEFRQIMASRAFEATSRYDALVTSYLRP
jgi:phosphoribosylaminoimidazolecarboxamide formyltransferase/IMP cyclohydrolase